jgi:flavin-dependent dehydrogenase
MKKITIIGAGPAGLAAAINLAKAGYKVKVYEKNKDVGLKLNGDFQGLENWTSKEDILESLKKMNIKINFPYSARCLQEVYGPDLNKTTMISKKPFYYLVRRGNLKGTLDTGLKKQAEETGVEIIYNKKIEHIDERSIIGVGAQQVDGIGVGITFDTKMKDRSIVILDDNMAPKAYAYLLIWNGKGTLVTCMFKGYNKGNEYFKKALENFKKIVDLDMKNIKHFGGFINFFLQKSNFKNNKIYVGECAGFQDYMWGFGMRYAMTSGYLAAKSVIENKDYNILWKKEFGGMLKTSLSNRFLFGKLGNSGYKKLIKIMKDNPHKFLMKNYKPSFTKKLIFPIAKLSYKAKKRKKCII